MTMKSQNLSIMMTDIQGYTSASASSSREEILNIIHRHNQLMQPVINFYGGKIIKSIGDAFLVVFTSATDAVVCAIIIQLILREYNAKQEINPSCKLNLRVVINTGDVSVDNNDIFGDAVNITARMEGLECFPGNTIGISEATYLLMNRNEIVAEKIGPKEMKGIPYPVVVYLVPLERQKLTSIPTKLLELVERSVNANANQISRAKISADLSEWSKAITSFLNENAVSSNIGDNIQILGQNIKRNAGDVNRSLRKTFGQASVLGDKSGVDLIDAEPKVRLKACAIDMAILFVSIVSLRIVWSWFIHPLFIGATKAGESRGIFETLIQFNLNYPFLVCFAYFLTCWFIFSASPGQIATRTAVVMNDGTRVNFETAAIRAALFIISGMFLFGIPALSLFTKLKKTMFDYLCNTRVVG